MLYQYVSYAYRTGDTGTEIVDELTKKVEETDANPKKRDMGGLEGVPVARQLANKGYKMKKIRRTNGI